MSEAVLNCRQIAEAATTAATDPAMMNRSSPDQGLERADQHGPQAAGRSPIAKAARQAVEKREGPAGYLRSTRLALD
jgi:hypothetical protein